MSFSNMRFGMRNPSGGSNVNWIEGSMSYTPSSLYSIISTNAYSGGLNIGRGSWEALVGTGALQP